MNPNPILKCERIRFYGRSNNYQMKLEWVDHSESVFKDRKCIYLLWVSSM